MPEPREASASNAAGAGVAAMLGATLLWGGTCVIFFFRAWVEERLLCDDPDYVAYALWMDRHGLFARLGRKIPFLTFEWRLQRWRKE